MKGAIKDRWHCVGDDDAQGGRKLLKNISSDSIITQSSVLYI